MPASSSKWRLSVEEMHRRRQLRPLSASASGYLHANARCASACARSGGELAVRERQQLAVCAELTIARIKAGVTRRVALVAQTLCGASLCHGQGERRVRNDDSTALTVALLQRKPFHKSPPHTWRTLHDYYRSYCSASPLSRTHCKPT